MDSSGTNFSDLKNANFNTCFFFCFFFTKNVKTKINDTKTFIYDQFLSQKTKIIKPKKLEKGAFFLTFFSQIHGPFWDNSIKKIFLVNIKNFHNYKKKFSSQL